MLSVRQQSSRARRHEEEPSESYAKPSRGRLASSSAAEAPFSLVLYNCKFFKSGTGRSSRFCCVGAAVELASSEIASCVADEAPLSLADNVSPLGALMHRVCDPDEGISPYSSGARQITFPDETEARECCAGRHLAPPLDFANWLCILLGRALENGYPAAHWATCRACRRERKDVCRTGSSHTESLSRVAELRTSGQRTAPVGARGGAGTTKILWSVSAPYQLLV